MSRTIKTMPAVVQAIDAHAFIEYHNHEKGPCDLPPKPTFDNAGWCSGQRCQWEYSRTFTCEADHFCGCPLCTEQSWRRMVRRQDRHAAKRETRQILKYGED